MTILSALKHLLIFNKPPSHIYKYEGKHANLHEENNASEPGGE